jgi:hypothetical protein
VLSASPFVLTNDSPPGLMTRLMALRMIMRRVQLSAHSLDTELLAMQSRKAPIKHRLADCEFAVSNRASLCKLTRSRSNRLTNSSLRAYSHVSFAFLPNQRPAITLVSPYALDFRSVQLRVAVRVAMIDCKTYVHLLDHAFPRSSPHLRYVRNTDSLVCLSPEPRGLFQHRAMLLLNLDSEHYMFLLNQSSSSAGSSPHRAHAAVYIVVNGDLYSTRAPSPPLRSAIRRT